MKMMIGNKPDNLRITGESRENHGRITGESRENHGYKLKVFIFLFLLLNILSLSCSNYYARKLFADEFTLRGNFLNDHDKLSGVVQASPGIEITPMNGNAFIVPENKSLFRVKVFDDPIPQSDTNGLIHFVLEYRFASSLIFNHNISEPDRIQLYVDHVTLKSAENTGEHNNNNSEAVNRGRDKIISIPTSGNDAEVIIDRNRRYIPFIKNLSLPSGKYKDLRIHFKKNGSIVVNKTVYPVSIETEDVGFNEVFDVTAGKITTLHTVPAREYRGGENGNPGKKDNQGATSADIKSNEAYRSIPHPDEHNETELKKLQVHIKTKAVDFSVSNPVSEIYIEMLRLEAVSASGEHFLLNDKDTIFELLGLRNGAVALAGHNMLPEGDYAYFELTLGTRNTVVVSESTEPVPVTIEYLSQDKLRFEGPFHLRGGRITELFLHFDPNRSVFYTNKYGYIFDPTVIAASVISMTAEQDQRLIDALGNRVNLVVPEADVVFQGNVDSLQYLMAGSSDSDRKIYTDLNLSVMDRIRGDIGPEMQLRMIGGRVNDLELRVAEMPKFVEGETFIIFLKKYNDRYSVVKGELGKVSL